jgi:hypothetical protein
MANEYCIDCGCEHLGWPTKPMRCDICDTAFKYEKREVKLHKEIEELKNKIKELENNNPETRDYMELRDSTDKIIVEREEWKNKCIQIEFKYLNYLSLMEKIKTLIEFFERGML